MDCISFKNELLDFIQQVFSNVDCLFRDVVEHYGLTMIQTRILAEIKNNERLTVGNLGHMLRASSGNTSTACKKLEKLGFIVRKRDQIDERVVNLELTQLGTETIEQIEAALQKKYAAVLDKISENDFKEITLCMNKIKDMLGMFETYKKCGSVDGDVTIQMPDATIKACSGEKESLHENAT